MSARSSARPVRWALASLAICAATIAGAAAQNYPTRPIRMIVPFAPSGGIDILARTIAQKLSESLGQSVVVDNRAGGSGIVGTDTVAKAAPDGYTILMTSSAHTIVPNVTAKLPFDALNDFAPVTQVTTQPYIMGIHPSLPAKSVKEFIALAKAKPRQLNYGSGGNGTAPHLAGELLKTAAGIDLVHVPYKGGGPALLALISGEVTMLFSSLSSTLPQVKAEKLRALAVSSAARSPAAPGLPTVSEAGVRGFEVTSWYGVLMPAKTPKARVSKLHGEIARILQTPEVKERLATEGTDPVGSTPEQFGAYIKAEIDKWGKVVKAAGTRAE